MKNVKKMGLIILVLFLCLIIDRHCMGFYLSGEELGFGSERQNASRAGSLKKYFEHLFSQPAILGNTLFQTRKSDLEIKEEIERLVQAKTFKTYLDVLIQTKNEKVLDTLFAISFKEKIVGALEVFIALPKFCYRDGLLEYAVNSGEISLVYAITNKFGKKIGAQELSNAFDACFKDKEGQMQALLLQFSSDMTKKESVDAFESCFKDKKRHAIAQFLEDTYADVLAQLFLKN